MPTAGKKKGFSLSRITTDPKLEVEGTWIEYGGARFLVARVNNPKFEKRVKDLMRPLRMEAGSGAIEPDKVIDLTKRAASEHILLGWTDVYDDDECTIEVPYSSDTAYQKFVAVPELYRIIMLLSSDIENYRVGRLEAAKGN